MMPAAGGAPRSPALRLALACCAVLIIALFLALGSWQVQRLYWKRALIARVEQRVHAPAVAAPGVERWAQVNAGADEYRHVRVSGTFLYPYTTRVQASTELGSGFWLLTPMCSTDGNIVLVNRGFVALDAPAQPPPVTAQDSACRAGMAASHSVSGLLRISEPGGALLRHNDPLHQRWYSRDVAAIAAARGLPRVAPYFIDADAGQEALDASSMAETRPTGGLTVISFHDNHLVYAFTWYTLAAMLAGACLWIARDARRGHAREG
ncbi:surfeit locus 1 family protein [Oxalobacteraceae bacterium GrIS 1.11]